MQFAPRFWVLSTLCALGLSAGSGFAAVAINFDGLPSSYTPGVAFSFDVRLSGVASLAAYNLEVSVENGAVVPGVDFNATAVSGNPYLFPSTANFLTSSTPLGNALVVSMSDFNDPDGNFVLDDEPIVPGVNDVVARLTVITSPDATDFISLGIEFSTLLLLDADGNEVPGSNDPSLPFARIPAIVVPEVSTLTTTAMVSTALIGMIAVRRRERSAA